MNIIQRKSEAFDMDYIKVKPSANNSGPFVTCFKRKQTEAAPPPTPSCSERVIYPSAVRVELNFFPHQEQTQ